MKLSEIKAMLESTGLPVAYLQFKEGNAPALPFIVYKFNTTENFKADGEIYKEIMNIDVELYTRDKDIKAEAKIKEALNAAGLIWEQSEEYIDTEKCFENIFNFNTEV